VSARIILERILNRPRKSQVEKIVRVKMGKLFAAY